MSLAGVLTILLAAPPWPVAPEARPLAERLAPPEGFVRLPVEEGSFGGWLRALPVKPGRPDVRLFDGRRKGNQEAQWLVLDVDVGSRDLQQCADAVMRLFAEWQWASGGKDRICFRFSSGHPSAWSAWAKGRRLRVRGSRVESVEGARPDRSYRGFRSYLESVFTYAGTFSLARDLTKVSDPSLILPGDVFIHGGFPGHAVVVVDVVANAKGERMFAVAQSYMPAQDIHVLKNPAGSGPWYAAKRAGELKTPEWTFDYADSRALRTERMSVPTVALRTACRRRACAWRSCRSSDRRCLRRRTRRARSRPPPRPSRGSSRGSSSVFRWGEAASAP